MSVIKSICMLFSLFMLSACQSQSMNESTSISERPVSERLKDFDRLQRELNQRAKQEFLIYMSLKDMFADPQVRALARAAGKGRVKKIDKLVASGVDINATGALGATPLFWAFRNYKGFKRLLELGADPDVMYEDGGGIVIWAVEKPSKFLKLLIEYKADLDAINPHERTDHETPLMAALLYKKDNNVRTLLDAGADVNIVNKLGITAYSEAAMTGKFKHVYDMLLLGADHTVGFRERPFRLVIAHGERVLLDAARDSAYVENLHYLEKVKMFLANKGVNVPPQETFNKLTFDVNKGIYIDSNGTPILN